MKNTESKLYIINKNNKVVNVITKQIRYIWMFLLILVFCILKICNPIERMQIKYSVKDYLINGKKYKLEEIDTIRSDYNYLVG